MFVLKCYASEIVSVPASDTHDSNLKGRVGRANLRNSLGGVKVSLKCAFQLAHFSESCCGVKE
jgi:hypothetical protein